jgi:hypothetical protein
MRILRPIVQPLVLSMLDALRSIVGYDPAQTAMTPEQLAH